MKTIQLRKIEVLDVVITKEEYDALNKHPLYHSFLDDEWCDPEEITDVLEEAEYNDDIPAIIVDLFTRISNDNNFDLADFVSIFLF